jgi:glycosyltransferase involved in cell wall biosynthesis
LPASYFVYAGRKERGKNVALMCEWFIEYVRETGAQSKLVLLGGGDVSLLPRSLLIVDLGTVSEAAKRQVVSGARALINLSNNESFSIVIVEAWLLGVPVIASARCDVTTGHVRRANGGLLSTAAKSSQPPSLILKATKRSHPIRRERKNLRGASFFVRSGVGKIPSCVVSQWPTVIATLRSIHQLCDEDTD